MPTAATSAEIEALRVRRAALRLERDIRRLQAQVGGDATGAGLTEQFGARVDCREYLTDARDFTLAPAGLPATADDRRAGQFWPIYRCEQDLALIRGRARQAATLTPMYTGIIDALSHYVIGPGFMFTVHAAAPAEAGHSAARLVADVQDTIDRFLDDNEFCGALDREAHARSREDGEAFLLLLPAPDGRVVTRFLECEQVTEPADPRALEDWLGCGDEFPSCWRFGVHTPAADTSRALGYHVVADSAGRDWDYVPVGRLEHFKRNVTANAKRGVSDFFPVLGDLERESRLRRNTAQSAALQAAIAWILEPPAGMLTIPDRAPLTDPTGIRYQRPGPAASGSEIDARHYPPGTILRSTPGALYKPGPMGSERNPNFLLVGQYLLRAIATRWNMPEYLISADASNANYASSLVAEAPFVRAREADQRFFKRHFRSLLWKVLRLAWEAGRFSRHAVSWDTLTSLVDVQCEPPAVATRDTLQLAQTQDLQMRLGILSPRTAASQAGLDYDHECRAGAGRQPASDTVTTTSPITSSSLPPA